ncbi:hypothetical protein QYM36_010235 [Artemia franciscana]|uniref:Oxysterol-binding protein n=1 Tax=Artemia franciscana TaxID=6661 RepID=A0AA88HR73_ARTSF|nr:hypothetical protein QYM36_010235 [Artemia franciscana]
MSEDKSINLDESDIENTVTGLVWNESDVERHFKDQDLDEASHSEVDGINDAESLSTTAGPGDIPSETESEKDEGEGSADEVVETVYMEQEEGFLGVAGEQTEELADENKSFIWFLLKQLRPGMDLSKVVLPTFILEPRSFLDKLSDYYYHADIIGRAATENDPFTRMKTVVQWYLSGFYKKPKGLKKPYNPILGETFRCYWKHTNGSRTYYIAEQVSHHPPISALYVTNRQEGFTMSTAICTKSKYHGNSLSALLDGEARLTLLNRGEDYFITMPYAYCKGIFLGALSMELGGDVTLRCDKTGYSADLTFKLTPLFGKADQTNCISGKIKLGKETLATVEGHWDSVINLVDKKTGESQVLWHPTPEARKKRLKRFVVPIENQEEYESDRLWQHVAAAIKSEDQVKATEEKTKLEDVQRNEAKKRKESGSTWSAKFFEQDPETEQWFYKHSDVRPWDPRNDLYQYEKEFVICTRTKHRTPVVRSGSSSVVDRTGSTRQLKIPVQNEGLGHESIITSSKIPVMNGNLKEQLDVLRDDLMRMEGTIKSNESTLKQLVRTLDTKRERPSSRSELLLLILVVGIAQAFMMWSLLSKLQ